MQAEIDMQEDTICIFINVMHIFQYLAKKTHSTFRTNVPPTGQTLNSLSLGIARPEISERMGQTLNSLRPAIFESAIKGNLLIRGVLYINLEGFPISAEIIIIIIIIIIM